MLQEVILLKVLGLSISAGAGHVRAAKAVKNYFECNFKHIEMEIVDTLKYIHPFIDKIVIGSYLQTIKKSPKIYEKIYEFAEKEDALSNFSGVVNDVLSYKIKSLIEEVNPDVILCTHPFPLEMLSILKKKGKVSIPAAGILTDYAIHSFWLYDNIDAYVIPHEDFMQEVTDRGIAEEVVYPFGIPVNQDFLEPISKDDAKKRFGIDPDKLTLLLMGGGLGMGNIKNIYEALAKSSLDIQLIVCTGRNFNLKAQIEDISKSTDKKSVILTYTDEISAIMSASDILVTKPGGLTIAEALIKELPIIITSAIPGQEEKNADYLLNSGIAARVKDSCSIVSLVRQLAGSPTRLKHMREIAHEKAKPNAARDICSLLIELAKK